MLLHAPDSSTRSVSNQSHFSHMKSTSEAHAPNKVVSPLTPTSEAIIGRHGSLGLTSQAPTSSSSHCSLYPLDASHSTLFEHALTHSISSLATSLASPKDATPEVSALTVSSLPPHHEQTLSRAGAAVNAATAPAPRMPHPTSPHASLTPH